MERELILLETHRAEEGVEWGLSTDGPNCSPEHYLRCRDEAHARFILDQEKLRNIRPFMIACGATQAETGDRMAETVWRALHGFPLPVFD